MYQTLLLLLPSVTCRDKDYLSFLHSGSGVRSSRPQRLSCASKYGDMRNVFTMVYLTVGYLGALQYSQICVTTMVCLTVDGHIPPEASLKRSTVWPSAPQLTSAEVNLLTRSCMTNRSAVCLTRRRPYLTCRSEAYLAHLLCDNRSDATQYLLLLKVPGDTNTLPYLSGHREITMQRLTTSQRPSKEIPNPPMSYKSTQEIPTIPFS